MPLAKGKSKKTIRSNIAEFHTGKTYAATRRKFGKAVADRQAVAAAMRTAGKSKKAPAKKTRRKTLSGENEFHRPL